MKLLNRSDRPADGSIRGNMRAFRWPRRPTAGICFDGCDPDYVAAVLPTGAVPTLARMMREGYSAIADAVMPTFTNPNNVSIVCGAPPSVHGVAGNYYLDRGTGREVMMLDAALMRAPTILARFSQAGAAVAG